MLCPLHFASLFRKFKIEHFINKKKFFLNSDIQKPWRHQIMPKHETRNSFD